MVDISPFRGLIYNSKKAGDLSTVISPPYDVISEGLKNKLSGSNQYNIVRLILPADDGENKYAAAGELLKTWIREGVLEFDRDESYYMLEIGFDAERKSKKIIGFIGLAKIEPYSKNIILRHEKTLPKPRKDRYSLLKRSRTNFGLIYTIYRDRKKLVQKILDSYRNRKPSADIIPYYAQDLSLRLWKITDKKDIAAITDAMLDKKILIADGHHRYETSLMYRDKSSAAGQAPGPGKDALPEDFALTLFMESSQEDIRIYPTYRSFRFSDFTGLKIFLEKSSDCFNINTINIKNAVDITTYLDDLRKNSDKGFIFYSKKDRFYSFTVLKKEEQLKKCGFSSQELDVNILHNSLINTLEGLYGKSEVTFSHDFDFIIENVRNGKTDIGVFLNSPTIDEMEEICNSGRRMPQKSTFFWPKPSTGLVMYKFDK